MAEQQHEHCHWDIPGAVDERGCDCGLQEILDAWKEFRGRTCSRDVLANELRLLNRKIEELDEAMADPERIYQDTELVGGFVSSLDLTKTAEEIIDRAIRAIKGTKNGRSHS